MKKILSILLASAMLVCAMCVTASADVKVYTVTLEAPETVEVDPGQTYVPLTWNMTTNEGWSAFKFFIEFDGDVFSFPSADEATDIEEPDGAFGFFLQSAASVYKKNIGSVDANIYGFSGGVDPQITKDKSAILVVAKSAEENSTATGDFFTAFLNVAEDAAPGEYQIKITTDPNNCSAVEGPSVAVPQITWGTATVVVKGDEVDDRLNVVGAQIRVADANKGIASGFRFVNSITTDLYNTLKDADALPKSSSDTGVGFGSVVLPTALIPENEKLTKETAGAVIVPAVRLYQEPKETDTEYMFTACLTGYQATAAIYQRNLTVVPYVTYMDGENEVTLYGESYSTNIFEVAKAACSSGTETESVTEYLNNNILHVVDPATYPKNSWTGIYRP